MQKAGVFIVGAKRLPFGAFGGALVNHSATDLAVLAGIGALKASGVKPENVDHVIFDLPRHLSLTPPSVFDLSNILIHLPIKHPRLMLQKKWKENKNNNKTKAAWLIRSGNALQTSSDAIYLARHACLKIGIPDHVPALNVGRNCASGFQSAIDAAMQILIGDSDIVLAGGTESMSQAPFGVRGTRFGIPLFSNIQFEDFLSAIAMDTYCKHTMAMTAEVLGEKFKIKRENADSYAFQSQQRWKRAKTSGFFDVETEPVVLKSKKGEKIFDTDEHARETTLEALQKLKPSFKKDGLVTPGNASGVCDGAAAMVIASEESVKKHNLKPLVRIVDWTMVGCEPTIMGIGPVSAIQKLCKKAKVPLEKIDIIEINEAFAAQVLTVQNELKIDSEKLNVNGGAISIGHPLGASGSRILAHLSHEMSRRGAEFGLASCCVGGGQGVAILLQKA